jgi:hypothetical protein
VKEYGTDLQQIELSEENRKADRPSPHRRRRNQRGKSCVIEKTSGGGDKRKRRKVED